VALLLTLLIAPAHAAPDPGASATAPNRDILYTVADLGPLPQGFKYVLPYAISDDDTIAGDLQTEGGAHYGFIWTSKDGFKEIATAPAFGAGAMNTHGQVAGRQNDQPAVWTSAGGAHSLFPAKGAAWGINKVCDITGHAVNMNGRIDAFLWRDGEQVSDLGVPDGFDMSWGSGINASDQVVGFARINSPQVDHGMLWSASGEATDLGNLGYEGCDANAINDSGEVVGISNITETDSHAFLWKSGKMTDLGILPPANPPIPGASKSSGALAVNDAGDIAGFANGPGGDTACVWTGGKIYSLADHISPTAAPGWTFMEGSAINSQGQIVSAGTNFANMQFESHLFIFTPIASKTAAANPSAAAHPAASQ
jgi:probable HAF family extracellular repeat protein